MPVKQPWLRGSLPQRPCSPVWLPLGMPRSVGVIIATRTFPRGSRLSRRALVRKIDQREAIMLRDITLWLLGVPIIAIIAMHLLGILN